jgi:hypothetical protein
MNAIELIAEIDRTRLARAIQLKAQIDSKKLELECIRSQMRAQMNRDGVVKFKVPGVGTATLLPGREITLCDGCGARGTLDPYLKIEAEHG